MATASQGELCCVAMQQGQTCERSWGASCEFGLGRYRDEFIAPIASLLKRFSAVPVVLIIE